MMQDHVYELEKRHYEIVAQYEEEISRLRALLEGRGVPAHELAPSAVGGAVPPAGTPDEARSAAGAHAAPPGPAGRPNAKRARANGMAPPSAQDLRTRFKNEEREAAERDALGAPPAANATEEDPPRSRGDAPQEGGNELKKEGSDWVAIYNPKVQPVLDVNLVHTLIHDSVVCCVRFSPDGKFVATGCNRSAQIYDTKTGAKTCVLQDPQQSSEGDLYIRSVCFSPDGRSLATGAEDRQIRIWDIEKKTVRTLLSGHKQEIYALEYSRDGRILASGSGDKTVRIWDVEKGAIQHVLYTSPGLEYGPGVTSISISPDGRLVAAGALDTFVRVWDTHTGKLKGRLKGHKDSIYSVCFSPDGQTLLSGSLDKTLRLWDLASIIRALESPDEDNAVSTACLATFTGHDDYVLSVSESPDGQWIASGSKDRCVQFWDPHTAQTQLVFQGHKNSVIAINLSPANNLLVTGSGDFNARIWSYERM